jgi:hypothetical protein
MSEYIEHKAKSRERMRAVLAFIRKRNVEKQSFLQFAGILDEEKDKTRSVVAHFYRICADNNTSAWTARSQALFNTMEKMQAGEIPVPVSRRKPKPQADNE